MLLNHIKSQRQMPGASLRHYASNWKYLLSILSKKPNLITQLRLFIGSVCDGDVQRALLPLIRGKEDSLSTLDSIISFAIACERDIHALIEVCQTSPMEWTPTVSLVRNKVAQDVNQSSPFPWPASTPFIQPVIATSRLTIRLSAPLSSHTSRPTLASVHEAKVSVLLQVR